MANNHLIGSFPSLASNRFSFNVLRPRISRIEEEIGFVGMIEESMKNICPGSHKDAEILIFEFLMGEMALFQVEIV